MIMSETDSPYVTPSPFRNMAHGQRNESSYVTEVAHTIANIRGESTESVLPQLVSNAKDLFSLK